MSPPAAVLTFAKEKLMDSTECKARLELEGWMPVTAV